MRLFALGPKGEPHRDGQAARACLNRDSPGPCKPRGPLTAPGWALMGVTVCPACGQARGAWARPLPFQRNRQSGRKVHPEKWSLGVRGMAVRLAVWGGRGGVKAAEEGVWLRGGAGRLGKEV